MTDQITYPELIQPLNCISCEATLKSQFKNNNQALCQECTRKVLRENYSDYMRDIGNFDLNLLGQEKSRQREKRAIEYYKYFSK